MKPKYTSLRSSTIATAITSAFAPVLHASDYYWNTTTTGTWATGANWSDNATSAGTTGTVPLSTDTATFHQSSINGNTIVEFDANALISGLTFRNTGTTLLRSNSTTARLLTIGSGGITTNSGAGAVTLGNATNPLNLSLGAVQSWTNNSASLLTVVNGVANGGNLLTIGGAGNTTVSGIISGTGGLTKSGTGTLTLTGKNTYTGVTTASTGSLVGKDGGAANTTITPLGTGTLSIGSGATVTVDNSSAADFNNYGGGTITGSGNITFIGNTANRLIVGDNFSGFTGTITVGGNRVQLDKANTTAALNISSGAQLRTWTSQGSPIFGALTGSGIIQVVASGGPGGVTIGSGGADGIFTGTIQDGGGAISITKIGSGTQTLSGTNTYTGATTVNGGTLKLTSSLSSSSALRVGGGTFSYERAAAQTVNGLTVNAGSSVVTNTNTGTTNKLNLGAITRNAGGMVDFANASASNNVVTTTTTNTNGILGAWARVGDNWAANDGSGNIVAYTGYTDVNRLGGTISDGAATNVRIVEAGSSGDITLTSSGTTAINTLLQSATGGTATVEIGSGNTLRTSGIMVASGAGALTLNAGTLTAAAAGGELIVTSNSGNGLSIASAIADHTSASSLSKIGTGTLTLTGTNTYTGATIISGGTLSASNIVVSGGSSNLGNATSAVTLGSAGSQGTLSYTGNTATYTRGFTIGGAGGGRLDVTTSGQTLTLGTAGVTGTGLFTVGGAGNTTINTALTHTGGLTKVDGGTLTLNTANTYTGGTTVNGGKLLLGYFGGATGVGTIRGTLTVNAGATVDYSVANALGYNTSGGSVNVLNIVGGTVGGSNFVNHFWNNFQLNMTGGTLHLGGTTNEFLNPTVTVNSSAETARILRVVGSSAVMRLRDGTSGTFNVADGAQAVDLLIDLPIIDNAPSNITKTGAGTMALTAANTYTGNTTVSAGTLTFSGSGTIYNATNTATVSVASGAQIVASATTNNVLGFGSGATWNVAGTINSSGGGAQTLPATVNLNNGTLTGVANNTFGAFLTNAAYTTTLTANGANNLISSANFGMSNSSTLALNTPLATDALSVTAPLGLAGQTGSLTKSGLGTVTLSGANIYTGATNVNNGTLIIDGSTSSTSIVTVASGATLGGSGTVGGNTTISGTLAPGNSIDKLGLNSDLTFNAGAVFAWELAPDIVGNTVGTRATHYDAVNVGGTLGGSGGIFRAVLTTGSFADAFWTSNRSWTDIFMNTAETSSVNYASIFTAMEYWQGETNVTDTIGSYGSFGISGSTLTWTAVPEPSTALVSLLLTAGLLRRRRK